MRTKTKQRVTKKETATVMVTAMVGAVEIIQTKESKEEMGP